ncbi:flagellar protein FliT [Bordetella pertussis]|nr:flagellar protein FliT [Bordetella pertussis]AMG88838.2 flagellar protein FliT [Bordetella bronchiseptica]AWP63772.1 flagellar protein FliT [Bordetella parapertussis]ETH90701.1 flagellar protein FliT [Bordetella pertussis STO1-CHOC-0019]KAK65566.1 flagellar protein FliT [Bordetella bronchiseptica 980-2]PNO95100.1 flagellar protein FliT [Bordetella pertussis 18323]CAE33086.1 flagellar protein FliT [Bordetella bronchiseptica RB50]CCJ49759.1 flagellar protein FliT [Bordetella parapertussis B
MSSRPQREKSMTALTQHAPVLEIYQDIANLTSRMLAAANASNWDLVLNHGQEYVCLVERLRELEPGEPLDEAARGMKFDLLVRILENDAAVRDLALPQLARLSDLLGRMKRQQSLLATYSGKANGT